MQLRGQRSRVKPALGILPLPEGNFGSAWMLTNVLNRNLQSSAHGFTTRLKVDQSRLLSRVYQSWSDSAIELHCAVRRIRPLCAIPMNLGAMPLDLRKIGCEMPRP